MAADHPMSMRNSRPRHLTLLLCILVLFTAGPFLVTLRHGTFILNVLGVAVMLVASYAVGLRKVVFLIALTLSATSIVLTWWLSTAPGDGLVIASHLSFVVLLGFFAVMILGYVLRDEPVTADKIYAAICVYLLIGYAWTFVYSLLEELSPGAFAGPTAIPRDDYVGRVMQLRYFSFVTLTTMGYGDIVPHSPGARTMAVLEAVTGQLYLVALVGRLIGLHIVYSTASRESKVAEIKGQTPE